MRHHVRGGGVVALSSPDHHGLPVGWRHARRAYHGTGPGRRRDAHAGRAHHGGQGASLSRGRGDRMNDTLSGPDLTKGVAVSAIADGSMLTGHARGEPVLLVRRSDEFFAIGAVCTHYGAPLADGLLVGDTVRCPWHHACFSLRTGEALRAPALDRVSCWHVEQRDGSAYVGKKLESLGQQSPPAKAGMPESVVIVGGGAAGNAAAEMLRREGYSGRITMLSADTSVPCDRPNLSKGYLAGTAPEEFTVLRSQEFYGEHGIDLK